VEGEKLSAKHEATCVPMCVLSMEWAVSDFRAVVDFQGYRTFGTRHSSHLIESQGGLAWKRTLKII